MLQIPHANHSMVFAVPKEQLTRKRGAVSHVRRRQIAERVIRALGFAGL